MPRTVKCRRCRATERCTQQGPMEVEPQGWTVVTISGAPTQCMTLCRSCTADTRAILAIDPKAPADGRHAVVG